MEFSISWHTFINGEAAKLMIAEVYTDNVQEAVTNYSHLSIYVNSYLVSYAWSLEQLRYVIFSSRSSALITSTWNQ